MTLFEKGKVIGIVGPDGAGKTTLLRKIAGLFGDAPPDGLFGYMPQRFGLYEDLTVMQNLELFAKLKGVEPKREDLEFTGLIPFVDRLAGNLSGGMKQKLGLACAILGNPEKLILDEPSVGVDPISRRELWKMVQELKKKGAAILWSTTYLDEAAKCDEILFLSEGKELYKGAPPADMEHFFLEKLHYKEGSTLTAEPLQGMVKAEHLVKKYGSFTAVNDISFDVKPGEIFGLLGPNGAGKSTTFKMLCGLATPTSGKAETPDAKQLGYMAQKFSLYGNLTVEQNLQFFAGIYPVKMTMEETLKSFNLTEYRSVNAEKLPLGIRQRLSLAAAIAHFPSVLFLDEPTSGMDLVARKHFWSQMQHLAKTGRALLITTHFMDEAEYCDRIGLVYKGQMIHLDTPANLKKIAGPTLEDAFIRLIEEHDARVH